MSVRRPLMRVLRRFHTGAGSGTKSELPPSSSKTESSIRESSMMKRLVSCYKIDVERLRPIKALELGEIMTTPVKQA